MDEESNEFIENKTFDELTVGDTATLSHTVTQRDIDLFATVTGDMNPAHVDAAYAATSVFHHVIIHGMWGAGLISAAIGTKLPGPGAIYLGQDLRFLHPVSIGDTVTARLTVSDKSSTDSDVTLGCICTNQNHQTVITGTAHVRAPTIKVRRPRAILPEVRVDRYGRLDAIVTLARTGGTVTTAVVHPVDVQSLSAAVAAAQAGLIAPILIGPVAHIREIARTEGLDITSYPLIDASDGPSAAALAVAHVRDGSALLLMKGDLHTDELMHAVVATGIGLRTQQRISHVYVMDVPEFPRLLLLTDAAVNIAPTLEDKAGIVQNAIDLAHVLGIAQPRVAILAAVEVINPKMNSTLDAAALCKMAQRGQIIGGLLDGPLALDNAIDAGAAAEKGIVSDVAGRADILVVPDIEAGNMLAKQLTFLSGAEAAGIVLGARVPIILTSRADSAGTRLVSCAVGVLLARTRQTA